MNDTWGHETGDAVLRAIGRTLSGAARTEDFIARWGGEEFVVLVRESEIPGLSAAGERLRRMVAAASVSLPGAEVGVTVSIGGTLARPAETGAELLRRADVLLYRSKERGRNQVTSRLASAYRTSGLYLMRCGWSASAPSRRLRSAS